MDLKTLGQQITGAHALLAVFTKQEILRIEDAEGDALAAALVGVAKHYDMTPNPVVVAWLQLLATLGAVYGPKIVLINLSRKMAREQSQHSRAAPEQDIHQGSYASTTYTGDVLDAAMPASATVIPGRFKFD